MDISVIIVNYKNKDKTLNCLQSLVTADWGDLSHEIIIVDNASNDGSGEAIKAAYPQVKLIKSEKNLGMGGGNNLGAKEAKGEFILVLNPDTVIKDQAILKLHQHLSNNAEAAIAGPKLLNTDGSLQYSCLRFPKVYTPVLRRTFFGGWASKHLDLFLMKDYDHEQPRQVDWLMGSCLLIKRDVLDKNGKIFDEKYFMYFEDTDLCRRIKQEHGRQVVYYPESIVIHDHARQSAGKPWYIAPFVDSLTREHLKSWVKYFLPFK